jgi:SecD/SecF fusion protein
MLKLRKEQLENVLTDAQAILRDARVGGVRGSIERDSVLLRASTPSIAAAAERALRASQGNDAGQSLQITILSDGTLELQPGQTVYAARQQSALRQSIEIVRRRIDAIGVAEPTVQALGSNRILVQLPGVQACIDPHSAR